MKLADRIVAALEAPPKGNLRIPDSEVRGLNAQITAAGRRSFVLRYRFHGVGRLMTIGEFPTWLTAAARNEAKRLSRLIDQGIDPLSEREREREAPTVAVLAARFEAEHLPAKRPRAAHEYRALLKTYILPALGHLKVADVTSSDAARLHREITRAGKPVRANRCLACMQVLFTHAIGWKMRADNPARGGRWGVPMNPEDARQRFLSEVEIARLAEVLARYPERTTAALIRFLLLTGCRFGEASTATWAQIDFEHGTWSKPSSGTKQKRQHIVPLSAPALAILSELRAEASGAYVFPSSKTGGALVTIKTAWRGIRREAGLEDVRLHDLRHSFASLLAGSGASLQLIGSLLGHSQFATTMRYAHLTDAARRAAVERVGAAVAGAPSAEVIELGGRRR